jgi:hypothetical protein
MIAWILDDYHGYTAAFRISRGSGGDNDRRMLCVRADAGGERTLLQKGGEETPRHAIPGLGSEDTIEEKGTMT